MNFYDNEKGDFTIVLNIQIWCHFLELEDLSIWLIIKILTSILFKEDL